MVRNSAAPYHLLQRVTRDMEISRITIHDPCAFQSNWQIPVWLTPIITLIIYTGIEMNTTAKTKTKIITLWDFNDATDIRMLNIAPQ